MAEQQTYMLNPTPRSAEVGSFLVRLALCPVFAVLGIVLWLVYPSSQNGTSQPGNGTTLVSLPSGSIFDHTHPQGLNSTVAIQYLPINLEDPLAISLVCILAIATGFAYIIIQAQRVDKTRKLESSSREDYHNRSWNTSFSQEMQEACRDAGQADRVMAFLIFSTTGLFCLAAWTSRILDGAFGKAVPPSREQLEELSEGIGGSLVLGAQSLPWNYTREAWVCGWKERVLDPAAASQFSTSCTRIVSSPSDDVLWYRFVLPC
ncbi:uncharacterized protein M437DRAFT_66482 [Aureobasidium melanogenum CBS 110374]|uniref:Uncharacterized protein n=1 Tax=Aureobasidium melanogenum (strain CBS 110374) TaxID=1043003 RepID=A0A074VY79_AURM1|nr:uncharacterized protein M437DRAFT_66482 [Aureobasidium melanogenum CBS 110374]KEQ62627.1 hypothetical protein M437DRAFT_66482 [Aureobasidium melanogenum CBS 110374]